MDTQQHQKYLEVINTIGVEKVQQLYCMLGHQRISMATLQKLIVKKQQHHTLKENKPVRELAKRLKVSHMTVYRYLRKKSNKTAGNARKRLFDLN